MWLCTKSITDNSKIGPGHLFATDVYDQLLSFSLHSCIIMANFEDPLLPPELEKLVVEMAMQEYICCKYNLADNQLRLHIQLTARRFYQWSVANVSIDSVLKK